MIISRNLGYHLNVFTNIQDFMKVKNIVAKEKIKNIKNLISIFPNKKYYTE